MFENLINFAKTILTKEKNVKVVEKVNYSKFKAFLENLSKKDPMYEPIMSAVELCDEALKIIANRMVLVRQVQNLNEKIMELECFGQLSDEEAKQLKHLLDLFVALTKDRNVLRYQLTGFDPSLEKMLNLESDASLALNHIQEAEKKQRIFRHDLGHLQGEKADLEYEREQLEAGLRFINKFAIAMTFIFGSVTMFLGYLAMLGTVQVFFMVFLLTVLLIFVVALIYSFRKRMTYELNINIRKQRRAVEFINKKSALYAHYTNFLTFEYTKYKVNSSQMLANNLREFGNYKHVTSRVDSVRNILYETERQLETFMREKKININRFDIENFAKTVNVVDKVDAHQSLLKNRSSMEERLLLMDERHEEISLLLEELKAEDKSEDGVVESIIQTYFEEVGRLMYVMEKRDIEETPEEMPEDAGVTEEKSAS